VEELKVVDTAVEPTSTCDALTKFVPVRVMVVEGLSEAMVDGEMELREGIGLGVDCWKFVAVVEEFPHPARRAASKKAAIESAVYATPISDNA
jgi:hypothetical protein